MNDIIMNTTIDLLNNEGEAILGFKNNIDQEYIQAIKSIHKCPGKIIFSGIGKSGIIAKKISATLNSIGKTSIFLHPIEALHGDIGILDHKDILIVLSKSGETEELFTFMKYTLKLGIKIISILGSRESSIAKLSHINIVYSIKKEACPLAVAPTTSTTVSLAIGDAIAACIIKLNNMKIEDFVKYHPGGSIGREYYLTISHIMKKNDENPQAFPGADIKTVISIINSKNMGAVNIIDEKGMLLGIITDGDIRRSILKNPDFLNLKAADIMTKNPVKIYETDFAIKAIDLIENRPSQIPVLPVINKEGINTGIVRVHDLIKAGL